MHRFHRELRRGTLAVIAAFSALALARCGQRPDTPVLPPAPEARLPAHTSRGEIRQLPHPTMGHLLTIHHEAVPNFEGQDGSIGMNAHEMPFPEIAAGVDLAGFRVGDAVSFTFEVDWEKPTYRIVRLEHLKPGVELRLDAPSPADPASPRPTALFDPDAERSYVIRGIVRSLPDAAHPQREFMVQHDEIPDFVGQNGTVGMPAMMMRFPTPASGVSLEDLRAGDVVEFRWIVQWERGRLRDRAEDLRLIERPN